MERNGKTSAYSMPPCGLEAGRAKRENKPGLCC